VSPDTRANAPTRFDHAAAGVRVRQKPHPAVLERVRPDTGPPAVAEQMHGRAGRRHPRGPLDQHDRRQRAAVPAERHVGRGHKGAEGPAVLLLRVQSPERPAEAAGDRGQGSRILGTGQADAIAFGYVRTGCGIKRTAGDQTWDFRGGARSWTTKR